MDWARKKCWVVLSTASMVFVGLVACQTNGGAEAPQERDSPVLSTSAPSPRSEVTVDRIAYVNATGELFTINPDGSDPRPLTGGVQVTSAPQGLIAASPLNCTASYAWPAWSPDGTKIAISRVDLSGRRSEISIEVIDTATARSKTAYDEQAGGMVAQGEPHYLYWSPDGKYRAFIASTPQGLTLFIDDPVDSAQPVAVETGAPLYFQWVADSSSLLVHIGADLKLVEIPFSNTPRLLLKTTALFRAPALSPDGKNFAFVQENGPGTSLFIASIDDPDSLTELLDVGTLSALAWSPDGAELAVADQSHPRNGIFQRLRVVPTGGGQSRTIGEGPILAFFWSPNGGRIAWVGVDLEKSTLEWMTVDSSGESQKRLFRFQPSNDFITLLSFFDQYAYSNSPWAPDGTHLVVAGTREQSSGQRNGQTPREDRVFVLEATGTAAPRDIAAGTLAVWSWN